MEWHTRRDARPWRPSLSGVFPLSAFRASAFVERAFLISRVRK